MSDPLDLDKLRRASLDAAKALDDRARVEDERDDAQDAAIAELRKKVEAGRSAPSASRNGEPCIVTITGTATPQGR